MRSSAPAAEPRSDLIPPPDVPLHLLRSLRVPDREAVGSIANRGYLPALLVVPQAMAT